jgi:hypothetical protein
VKVAAVTASLRGPAPAAAVVVPTYERREDVSRAVRSVLAQTRGDFELIVVDDGSTDGTGEALAGLDPRVRYVWQENRGVAAARNAGLRLATAPVVAFLDSDNVWLPGHLETVLGALGRHPRAVLASTCPEFMTTGRRRPARARLVDPLPEALVANAAGFVSCIAVRRAALERAGGFDERLRVAEDNDLWARLALLGPFSLVRTRTVVRHPSPGGLRAQGRLAGDYLAALRESSERVLADVEHLAGARARELLPAARAAVALARGIGAVARRDETSARAELAEACRLMPSLSQLSDLVFWRVMDAGRSRGELSESLALAASCWPDPGADTPLVLRAGAIGLALRDRRLGAAARLAAARPLLLRPRLGRLVVPGVLRRARRRLRRLADRA